MKCHDKTGTHDNRLVKVRIFASMSRCTFNCGYCVAAAGESMLSGKDLTVGLKRPRWSTENGRELAKLACSWVSRLPYRMGVRYDVNGEPFIDKDVMIDISWLTHQENVEYVEVLTNTSMFKKSLPSMKLQANFEKLTLFCTFHHTEISPELFVDNVLFAHRLGCRVIVNVLVSEDNTEEINQVLALCKQHKLPTSADILFPAFTNTINDDNGKTVRNFLKIDPFTNLMSVPQRIDDAFSIVANSGPLGEDLRFLAAMLVGLYGIPEDRKCSSGYDYIFIDRFGDIYSCFCYADIKYNKLGTIFEPAEKFALRNDEYAVCRYKETCHQKEEYGNIDIYREHHSLEYPSLNHYNIPTKACNYEQLKVSRMTILSLARRTLNHQREGIFNA